MHRIIGLVVLTLGSVGQQSLAKECNITVFFDFSTSGLMLAEQDSIMNGVKAKFNFTVGGINIASKLCFTGQAPPTPQHKIVFDNNLIARTYGSTLGNASKVYRKKLTHGHWRNVFDTPAKQKASLIETTAHELGHQFLPGEGHNCSAPTEPRSVNDANGDLYIAQAGQGNLPNGRPGLMAKGCKVSPPELVANQMEFSQQEKQDVAMSIEREKAQRSKTPKRSGQRTDLQMIEGDRFNPENAQGPWPPPFPTDRWDQWLDIEVSLQGNASWDFGFVTDDEGFIQLLAAGEAFSTLAFEPGAILDFAIREAGRPEEERHAMSEVGSILKLSDPVFGSRAIDPLVEADYYYRYAVMSFDPGSSPRFLDSLLRCDRKRDGGQNEAQAVQSRT